MRLLIITLTFALPQLIYGQIKFDCQIGGSNFIGYSINTEFDLKLSKEKEHYLSPRFGIGNMFYGFSNSTSIMHYGLHYRINKFGFGTEISGFTKNPFIKDDQNEFVDMIIYPNINYTIELKKYAKWYVKISTGMYLAYSRVNHPSGQGRLNWEGDPIPGLGLNLGYKF